MLAQNETLMITHEQSSYELQKTVQTGSAQFKTEYSAK
jgi:hypothetical protein